MSKDPAVLIYFDKWISSTNGMKAHYRAWYMDLLMYQYDNPEGIPDDKDFIAGICRVLPSEYELFKQMLEQVLEQKFELIGNKWVNHVANEIISKRQDFKAKRTKSGNIGVIIKLAKTIKGFTPKYLTKLKEYLFEMDIKEIEKAKDKQVLEQMLKLYVDEDEDEDEDININNSISNNIKINNKIEFSVFWDLYDKKVGDKEGCKKKWDKLSFDTQNKIIETLPGFKSKIEDKKFQPHPATYLNQKRWNDEKPEANQPIPAIEGETEEERFHREWKAKNKVIPLH
ncbi:Uncharacterized conserved protein YdaU, DUF1376 family [Chryseobacterium oranimense]|uniref:Uncharacterized conserved protein YdaU, DUF1376 family n=1 Tax=Chryseobacterium oranimense TaxID=421058 RepID=A0A1M5X801_9FLAO|nr:DUF1376 domain-containing protein [Chryseobacterium oranimense]SHH95614.1 Uncharacterized conserved protein YdaU, DUF1376 family [Chryseobacterium oranimense]